MSDQARPRTGELLIIGGGTAFRDGAGRVFTKRPIANYINELSLGFDRCTWVASREERVAFDAPLTPSVVVLDVPSAWLEWTISWYRTLRVAWTAKYVIYFLPNFCLPVIPFIRLFSDRLLVYLAGDYAAAVRQGRQSGRSLAWAFLSRLSAELPMRCADVVIARGKYLADVARAFNDSVVETVPLGNRTSSVAISDDGIAANSESAARLLFVGKVTYGKGIGILMNTFLELVKQSGYELATLEIVGDGPMLGELREFVSRYGLSANARIHGWVNDELAMQQFYLSADVVVVPSVDAVEGVPRVIDEAIANGVPVVASTVGGVSSEYSSGEVLLVPPGDERTLLEAIRSVMENAAVRDGLIHCAQHRRTLLRHAETAATQHYRLLASTKKCGHQD